MITGADEQPLDLRQVVESEWAVIAGRRRAAGYEPDVSPGGRPAGLSGLALSGGGIRSATFCLGVLQAFHARGLLTAFDYLSTVSGGGFIGGWLTAWLARSASNVGFPPSESLALASGPAPARVDDPVHHIRLFSNYLTPRKGLLSGDTWRAITFVLRGLSLTWAVLVPITFSVILLGELYFVGLDPTWLPGGLGREDLKWRLALILLPTGGMAGWLVVLTSIWLRYGRDRNWLAIATPWVGLAVAVVVFVALAISPYQGPTAPGTLVRNPLGDWLSAWASWFTTAPGMLLGVWAAGAFALARWATRGPAADPGHWARHADVMRNQITRVQSALLLALLVTTFVLVAGGFAHTVVPYLLFAEGPRSLAAAYVAAAGGWLAVIAAVVSALFTAWRTAPTAGSDAGRSDGAGPLAKAAIAATPPLVLVVGGLGLAWAGHELLASLMSRVGAGSLRLLVVGASTGFILCGVFAWSEVAREPDRWHGAAWQIRTGTLVLFAGTLVEFLVLHGDLAAYSTPRRAFVAGMALAALAGSALMAGAGALLKKRDQAANTRPCWLLGLAFGWLAALLLLGFSSVSAFTGVRLALALVATVMAWTLAIGWTTDPNLLSLHGFYKARLTRAYLGASNRARRDGAVDISEAVEGDDLLLSTIREGVERGGPYPLINATLNLVGDRDLAAAQRRCDRFLFSPLFCGSSRTQYRPTTSYAGGSLHLGTCMAISGAAVSPAMGSLSPGAALAVVMTLLNVRLGYWIPTPNRSMWRAPTATLWPWYLLRELLSQTTDLSSYCHLSDGGHFDNTGLYSLVERGCRHIVLIDSGEDGGRRFEDLSNALRRCRIDLGTRVEIDLEPLRGADGPGAACVAIGKVHYGSEHADALGLEAEDRVGTLVVLKPTSIAGEPVDVSGYRLRNTSFPNETTADQWFDEAQFESYRCLGESIAARVLQSAQALLPGSHGVAPAGPPRVAAAFRGLAGDGAAVAG